MKKTTLARASALALALGIVAVHSSVAQVLTPGATIQGPSVNGAPATGATGPLGQIRSGLFGQFAPSDNWLALGESPFGVGGVLPYGLRLQKNSQFGLFNQVTNPATGAEDLVVGWGENASSLLRLRFLSNQFTNQFTDVLKLQGGTLAPAAEITATALTGGETPLRIGVADAPTDFFTISNGTGAAGQFIPTIVGTRTTDTREALFFGGNITPGNDVADPFGNLRPLVNVQGRLSNNTQVVNRPIFAVSNLTQPVFTVSPTGDVSSGNISGGSITSGTIVAFGDVYANNFITFSDQRFKEDVKTIENGLGLIRQMRGTTYTFKQSTEFAKRNFPKERQYGFIAQEMQKTLPEAVKQQKDGFYGVNYIEVVPVLVEAVKQLDAKQAETTELQQQVADLKAQMAELRALVEGKTGQAPGTQPTPTAPDMSQVKLEQNAPNPFQEATRIEYALPAGVTSAVLSIVDMQGRTVRSIADLASGRHTVEIKAGSLPAGVYLYTLTVNGKEATSKRMVLTR
ncbi:tail fiber domain-containing protein [Hymenobacter ruricola]|uniref:Tail fiber domain-containing protein n=1 Tax=Hymenobacter ruricola TaxID=2791023 RepID=A0ABS0I1M5_9BACT|nr:tail fiber domain-containing protein [Hymenobacter ruricola]MBF9220830.1 tail fiber domain-containing protein [Hymenobacter ruricola]